jgi:hypothetical protein
LELLAQGFKLKDFEIQTKDNLDSKKEFKSRIWKIDSKRVRDPNNSIFFLKSARLFKGFSE